MVWSLNAADQAAGRNGDVVGVAASGISHGSEKGRLNDDWSHVEAAVSVISEAEAVDLHGLHCVRRRRCERECQRCDCERPSIDAGHEDYLLMQVSAGKEERELAAHKSQNSK